MKILETAKLYFKRIADRLTPVVTAVKSIYKEVVNTLTHLLHTGNSGIHLLQTSKDMMTETAKAIGNSGKAVFYNLPKAAIAKYNQESKKSESAVQDAFSDLSFAYQNASAAVKHGSSSVAAGYHFLSKTASTCKHGFLAGYNTAELAIEMGKLAYDGAACIAGAAQEVYSSYTPSFETLKQSTALINLKSQNAAAPLIEEIELSEIKHLTQVAAAAA